MIRDRGNIKWTSLMLPEHVKMVRQHYLEEDYQSKPEIDEQQQELLNEKINEALEFGSEVEIKFFEDHKIKLLIGTIHYVNVMEKKLHVLNQREQTRYIKLENVLDIQN
ncbi:YolD-like family protein [Sutcliffiella sp. FSL R7-0096]|uniref:YolD-like family protein n=1 Tax=Sutcliffiella sp. FSL R7-0096 TaxID=2921670 RepID=UPI00315A7B51